MVVAEALNAALTRKAKATNLRRVQHRASSLWTLIGKALLDGILKTVTTHVSNRKESSQPWQNQHTSVTHSCVAATFE